MAHRLVDNTHRTPLTTRQSVQPRRSTGPVSGAAAALTSPGLPVSVQRYKLERVRFNEDAQKLRASYSNPASTANLALAYPVKADERVRVGSGSINYVAAWSDRSKGLAGHAERLAIGKTNLHRTGEPKEKRGTWVAQVYTELAPCNQYLEGCRQELKKMLEDDAVVTYTAMYNGSEAIQQPLISRAQFIAEAQFLLEEVTQAGAYETKDAHLSWLNNLIKSLKEDWPKNCEPGRVGEFINIYRALVSKEIDKEFDAVPGGLDIRSRNGFIEQFNPWTYKRVVKYGEVKKWIHSMAVAKQDEEFLAAVACADRGDYIGSDQPAVQLGPPPAVAMPPLGLAYIAAAGSSFTSSGPWPTPVGAPPVTAWPQLAAGQRLPTPQLPSRRLISPATTTTTIPTTTTTTTTTTAPTVPYGGYGSNKRPLPQNIAPGVGASRSGSPAKRPKPTISPPTDPQLDYLNRLIKENWDVKVDQMLKNMGLPSRAQNETVDGLVARLGPLTIDKVSGLIKQLTQ